MRVVVSLEFLDLIWDTFAQLREPHKKRYENQLSYKPYGGIKA